MKHFVASARILGLLFAALGVIGVSTARAQTAEGTVITNVSTVTFTDANGGTYAPISASTNVTVGFTGGLSFAGSASVSPISASTADTMTFTYTNAGNGNDSLRVTEAISIGGIITVTGYRVNGTTYATLANLNTALSGILVAQNGTLVVKVIYDVAANKGGLTTNYTLTGFSRRDATKTQAAITAVNPSLTASVAVTPDNGQNITKLPSNGTNYTFTFTVQNNANGTDGFTLAGSKTGSAITIVSVNGTAGSSGTIASLAAGATQNVDVVYSIGNVAAGTKDTLILTATSTSNGTVHDNGKADITVVRPAVAIAKTAYLDDQTTLVGATLVVPGQFIQYKITVTNNGAAPASSVVVSDTLPSQLTYNANTPDAAGWTIGNVSGAVTATLSGTLAAAGSRFFWIRVRIN